MESLKRAKAGNLLNKNSKYKILHPGVDWENIKPTWKYEKYFLVPGRIMWTKNIEFAIEAFISFVQQSKSDRGFKLIIAGQVDTKSKNYLEKLKKMSGNGKNIEFVVNPSDYKMGKLYANCYATLATSFNEDWGLTPIEANAYGKAVLAVCGGGFKESQIQGKTGYLLKNNFAEFASKMLLLAKNGKLVTKMGNYSRTHSKQFSWSDFNQRMNKIIGRIPLRKFV
jgi:glycosyltransferase involved in cell wall biosynthesis